MRVCAVSQTIPPTETVSEVPARVDEPITGSAIASWVLAGLALLVIVVFHLVSALLGAFLVYELIGFIAPVIERHLINRWSRGFAAVSLAILIIALLTGAIAGTIAFLKSDAGSPQVFADRFQHVLLDARAKLPAAVQDCLPGTVDDLKIYFSGWLSQHSHEVQTLGRETLHLFVRGFIGMVIGALVSLFQVAPGKLQRPLAAALIERVSRFAEAFRHIVFAQLRISVINTVLTAIYLLILLPALGINLPLAKVLVVVTFFCGLLPIFGNIVSNLLIVVVSLSVSPLAAVMSTVFLVVIHKLEYFLNARIVATAIKALPWEVMIAILAMEAAFGLSGLAVAPIYYAYLKQELVDRGLV
jgi:predicted PurR-regulated permease PerM